MFALAPQTFFSFLSSDEAIQFKQLQAGKDGALYITFANELEKVRADIFRADALRSFFFVLIPAIIIFFTVKRQNLSGKMYNVAMVLTALFVVIDMYAVDQRYLNKSNFIDKRKADKPFVMDDVDKQILRDETLDYRVINLATSTFNDASTSYFHKSVGGYHGAKLRRYQDIIDHYLSKRDLNYFKVLNMLNTKYIIYQNDNGKKVSVNPEAYGNAWIVSKIKWVTTPNEEIDAIADTDVLDEAIINDEFRNVVGDFSASPAEGVVELVDYQPNQLTYAFDSSKDEMVVFSEIWTKKGWTMWIDGVESPLLRADYVLRAAVIPAGQHEIVMRYEPSIWRIGNTIQLITSLLILIGLVYVCYISFKK